MTKVTVDTNNYELTEHDSQRVISPTESNKTDQKSVSYDNPVFSDQRPSITSLGNGTLVTTKLEIKNGEADDDDDIEDKNNEGFERLTGDGHKLGLFVLSFAMFILVACAVFIAAWEIILRSSLGRLIQFISRANRNRPVWIRISKLLKRVAHILVFLAVALYVGLTVAQPRNLVSLIGIFALIILGTLGSKYPHQIRWKTVLYSFILQFLLAVFVIRVDAGFELFEFLGQEVTKFINNADAGAKFVFGETFEQHFYVFKITSIIIFLGSVINVLYYYGVMQYVIGKLAWLMQKCLNTTAAESMNAAANIFVGITEAPLLIMPLIPKMTTSELHAVLVGGFATMAGSVLATFILFGVPANHLIAASVMAAPGALGFAKLLLPETHKTKTSWDTVQNVPLSEQHNAIDALMTGAGNGLKICGYLIANLIAFISVLNFLDVSISWLFNLVHHPEVNFQYILGLLFYPFALITGISLRDCLLGSKLIGIKVSINEFIAYQELGKIRNLRNELIKNNTFPLYLNGTLTLPNDVSMLWDESSLVIMTYALCGFANFGSMGIALAALSVFAPTRKRTLIKIAPRALIAGNMVSLMTASIAGLLYDPLNVRGSPNLTNTTMI
ncbi:unnamed protein product [Rotaria sp. Silwood1]|nr:unnamed protein product [Rotaria sp. Silwood1]CAF4489167.1 unnamed protein product [Rotaria sp. Silwood1]